MYKLALKVTGILAGTLLSLSLMAADPIAVKKDHPKEYVVKQGDTLWDIASRFLDAPWQWPQVWEGNPQIGDPNLIYPGDVITMRFDANGKPILSVNGKSGQQHTIKLTPKIRVEQLDLPIPTLPLNAIHQFLTRPFVVEPNALDDAPYVVSNGRNHLVGSVGQKIYIRDSQRRLRKSRYLIVRPGKLLKHGETGKVLGQAVTYIGEVEQIRRGEPATGMVLHSEREIIDGDRLIPYSEDDPITTFYPQAPEDPIRCSIIDVLDGVTQVGQYNIVTLDCGKKAGVVPGDVLTISNRGNTIHDPYYSDPTYPERRNKTRNEMMDGERDYWSAEKWFVPDPNSRITLPDEPAGTLMIFRTFNKVSFALVMKASNDIRLLDRAQSPRLAQ